MLRNEYGIWRTVRAGFKDFLHRHQIDIRKDKYNDIGLYKELFGEESVRKRQFCNISAGAYFGFGAGLHHPCWVNADLDRPWRAEGWHPRYPEYDSRRNIKYDALAMDPIFLEDDSMYLVSCRYALGHISNDAARKMFSEILRILRPGGIVRIITPNTDLDYRAYIAGDRRYFYWEPGRVSIEQAFLKHFAATVSIDVAVGGNEKVTDEEFRRVFGDLSKEEALDYCVSKIDPEAHRKHRHLKRNWWNPGKVEAFLREAGFSDVMLSAFGQSQSPVMRNTIHFDTDYNELMLFVEARK